MRLKIKQLLIILVVMTGGLIFPISNGYGLTAEQVEKTAQKAVSIRQGMQRAGDQWQATETSMQDEIDRLEWKLKHLTWKNKKAAAYLATISEKKENLEKELAGYDKLLESLEPLLDRTHLELEVVVQKDLPFLPEERKAALIHLKRTLNDCEVGLLQKTAALFEVLHAEAEYGYKPMVEEAELEIDGRVYQVNRFNLGRLTLLALDRDGRRAWLWEPEASAYQPADRYARHIGQAIEMSNKTRLLDLVKLPVIRSAGRLEIEAESFTDINTDTDRP